MADETTSINTQKNVQIDVKFLGEVPVNKELMALKRKFDTFWPGWDSNL